MKNKSFKSNNEDTLRGTGLGSLGYTLSGKQTSTVKRLMSTFDDTPNNTSSKKNKKSVTCVKCNKTFNTTSGNLPKHKEFKHYFKRTNLDGTINAPTYCDGVALISEKIDNIVYKGNNFNVGDTVLYTTKKNIRQNSLNVFKNVTVDSKIKNIVMENSSYTYEPHYFITFENKEKINILLISDMISI